MKFIAVILAILPLAFAAPQIAPPPRRFKSPPSPLIGAPIEDRLGQSETTTTEVVTAPETTDVTIGPADAVAMP
ncbi:hypothetical protein MP638_000510 [Amoeboaphelidium occidentale]|nr:hypothetical protein MP638_000510 [Amoeboaphelidium occidentale]